MVVGERLNSIRQSKNISIYKLSQNSEVSENHIRNLESRIKHATVETLALLVQNLGMTMSEFFNEDDTISYPTQKEKTLLDSFSALPDETANAVLAFCEKLKNPS